VLFINVPIGVAVVILAPRFVTEPPRRAGRLDLPGALLSTVGLASLIYGFIRIGAGGSSFGEIAGIFAAAVVLLGLFIAVEVHSSSPLLPLHLIRDRTRGPIYLVLLCISAAVFGMFFFVSQYAQEGLHYSALTTGLAFLPLTAAIFGLSRIMSRVLTKTGPRPLLLCGTALIAGSLLWLSQTSPSQGYLDGIFGPLLLFGIGAGLSYLPMSATILGGVSGDDYGSAIGDVPGDAADRRGAGPRDPGQHRRRPRPCHDQGAARFCPGGRRSPRGLGIHPDKRGLHRRGRDSAPV
jgi:hypothetical protein